MVATLEKLRAEAEALQQRGDGDAAAKRIELAQQISAWVLRDPRPTLDAMKAVAAIDDLYGRSLLRNRHYGWARLFFQKNVARWRTWPAPTEETERLRREAEAAIAECDRLLSR